MVDDLDDIVAVVPQYDRVPADKETIPRRFGRWAKRRAGRIGAVEPVGEGRLSGAEIIRNKILICPLGACGYRLISRRSMDRAAMATFRAGYRSGGGFEKDKGDQCLDGV